MQEPLHSSPSIVTLVELRVLEGLSRGASLPLDQALTIGNDESSDLLLMDDGIAPAHARIAPVGDGFTLEIGADPGGTGTLRHLALGEPFDLGAARLVCCSTDTPWDALFTTTPRSSKPSTGAAEEHEAAVPPWRARLSLLLAIPAALMLLVALLFWIVSQDIAPAATSRDATPPPVDAGAIAQWAQEIDRRLRTADLPDLEAQPHQGLVRVSGMAPGAALPRLESVLKTARRERPDIRIVLQLKEAPPKPPPFRVKALVGGPQPRALLEDDVLLYPGDRHSGVSLVAINGTCLSLLREVDQQRMQVCLDQIRLPS